MVSSPDHSPIIGPAIRQIHPNKVGFIYKPADFEAHAAHLREHTKEKIALVLSGGGMSCIYIVGALIALFERYGLCEPNLIVAASGSAGTACYYKARQFYQMAYGWLNLLSDEKFMSGFSADIDYLVYTIFKTKNPIQTDRFRSNPIELQLAATDYQTADVVFMSPQAGSDIHLETNEIYEAMRASKALPIFYGKQVVIQGRTLIDSMLSAQTPFLIERALQNPTIDRVIAFDLTKPGGRSERVMDASSYYQGLFGDPDRSTFYELYKQGKLEREALRRAQLQNPKVTLIRPKGPLPADTLDNQREKLLATLIMGYREALENNALRHLLTGRFATASESPRHRLHTAPGLPPHVIHARGVVPHGPLSDHTSLPGSG
ncbi:patatin-like phospholipase family protein [Candidatus Peregrinibacteria bacterium]|nr:MAG: patatin-like phospholipase family protein [Candidatus Peregrinibacteria bacterium]